MAKHRAGRRTARRWLTVTAVLIVAAAAAGVALLRRDGGRDGPSAAAPCTPLTVVAATAYAPVLTALAPGLAAGTDCVALAVVTADGRTAGDAAAAAPADVWIPDDGAWATEAGAFTPARDAAGAGTVVATSPVLMLARDAEPPATWLALARAVAEGRRTLALTDPARSGAGLVGAGAAAAAIRADAGADAAAMWLQRARRTARSTAGPALPAAGREVGLVAEHALGAAGPGMRVRPGGDASALLRFTYLPSAAAAADPLRTGGLARLRAALTGPPAAPALAAAGLRTPDGAVPAGGRAAADLAAAPAADLDGPAVDRVFAAWYAADRRADVLVVLDTAAGTARPAPGGDEPLLTDAQRCAQEVVDALPADARAGLWTLAGRRHRVVVRPGPLDAGRRAALAGGLHALAPAGRAGPPDAAVLAAYTAARDGWRPGVPQRVLVVLDGRGAGAAGPADPDRLAADLAGARADDRPVDLAIVVFGGTNAAVAALERAVAPVGGYVGAPRTRPDLAAAFAHLATGGLRG
ncbi:substrate-binding domain-containing protein [Spirilliplanes yamanashiensis]|uniref:VWFA domain-containing protein n=1 Tax=Spirilliplanes yamanashiensis TaxID=42233 RepID=A0A8J4DK26_9ACTN|nr:substrate-binding domain-containing protein [Spirilliplanes yamanashiensis]MDP9817988.1 ABC-type molybdate transport system substrate-binding protein [Spirilliplanes yamanashiensis]GIJ04797.1 hypothetical protein Sya03_41490 [Spirilliplanes yamanashiensis]